MPLLKIADRFVDEKPRCLYDFPKAHKELWCEFWRANDGDYDKILNFAKRAGIENPVEWLEELHRFLFDVFCGCDELVKKASKDGFSGFLNKIADQHEKDPKEKRWYLDRGALPEDFVCWLKEAGKLEKPSEAISFLNNHIVNFGNDLYSEFLLLKTKQSSEIMSLASKMTKDAYDVEMQVLDEAVHPVRAHVVVGSLFKHKNFPGLEFECIDVNIPTSTNRINGTKRVIANTKYPVVTCKDEEGGIHVFDDVWNLIPVKAKLDKSIKKLIMKHKGDNPDFQHIKEALVNALSQDEVDTKLVKELAEDLKLPLSDIGL